MCGSARRAQHQQEEAKRQAGIEATAARIQAEQAEQRNLAMLKTLEPKPYTPPPVSTKAALGVKGVKPKQGVKSQALGSRRGIASLRIPLNIGQTGGTNIPS